MGLVEKLSYPLNEIVLGFSTTDLTLFLPIMYVEIKGFGPSWFRSWMRLPVGEAHVQLLATKVIAGGLTIGAVPMLKRFWNENRAVVWVRSCFHLIEKVLCHSRLTWHCLIWWASVVKDMLEGWVWLNALFDTSASTHLRKRLPATVKDAYNHATWYWGQDN